MIHVQADKWQLQTLQTPSQMEVSNLRVSLSVLQEEGEKKPPVNWRNHSEKGENKHRGWKDNYKSKLHTFTAVKLSHLLQNTK